jgi:hypothetical protein
MKMATLWHVAPCSRIEIDRRFRDAYCLHHHCDDSKFTDQNMIVQGGILRAYGQTDRQAGSVKRDCHILQMATAK